MLFCHIPSSMPSVCRALPCELASPLPPEVRFLMQDFRLMVNRSVRFALENDATAKGSLVKLAQSMAKEYHINFQHARTATEVALSLCKGHRRRLRKGKRCKVPYVYRPFLRTDDSTFHVSTENGHVRLSIRAGEWSGFDMKLSSYHLNALASGKIKQLVINEKNAVLVIEKQAPEPYVPTSVIALDTNERSLDGVALSPTKGTPISIPFPEISVIQHRHFVRRRKMAKKKRRDRRVGRKLLSKEGKRERDRVSQRLHLISNGLVKATAEVQAAIVLEDLHLPQGGGRGPRMRRRFSSWPQRELHRQIEYKAEERGVPVIKVDPRFTSKTCPRCGEIKQRRSRVGRVFVCDECGWRMDRQLNAGLNICKTALAEPPEGAMRRGLGGLRLDPDALADDAMIFLYSSGNAGAHGVSGGPGSTG
jgi:putative transposase